MAELLYYFNICCCFGCWSVVVSL